MKSGRTKILYGNSAAWAALLLVVIHQSLVASSAIFLTNVIRNFQDSQPYISDLYLYLLAMAIPYLPGCLSFTFLQRWANESHRALISSLIMQLAGSTQAYRNTALRERVTAVLARNSFPVLNDYVSFVHELASFSLNSLLSIAVIGFLLPTELIFGYLISLTLCVFIVLGLRKAITATSSEYENSYMTYSGILDKGWENITLGNSHNTLIWEERKNATGNAFYSISYRLEIYKQAGNILLAAASLLPTIYLIISIVHNRTSAPEIVAAVIVSLTRIFLILNSLSALVYKSLEFSSIRSRIDVILNLDARPQEAHDKYRNNPNIFLNGTAIKDTSQIIKILSDVNCGRFKITGPNGSGKSSALLRLKEIYGDRCFLLPTHGTHLLWRTNCSALSTGERICSHLQEILELEEIEYIFLDEWDANLDVTNRRSIDAILEEVSKTKVIVEVQHLRSAA